MSISIHPTNKKVTISVLLLIVIGCLSAFALTAYRNQPSALAAVKEDWSAGNIISDTAFTDKDSMSVSDIQAFLDSKITCDIWGTGKATEFGSSLTRAQYAASRGWAAPPYTCLNKYYEVPKITPGGNIPANNYSNPTSIPSGAQSAAWIIKDAANRYNISPKVLLVKIATESVGPLTSDNWPLFSQYRYAMGSHCPDSGPGGSANCDTAYAGFSIQMYSAAELMRWYLDSMDQSWWTYKKPGVNYVLWNVTQRGCGGANVTIQNKATAALYTYTPYQPNQAALNNMYGTGDNCSAYGNRNFWRVYWDWFGNTRTASYVPFSKPRKLELISSGQKINPLTSTPTGSVQQAGLVRKYVDKTLLLNGKWCYRTEADASSRKNACFTENQVQELSISYITIPSTEQMKQLKAGAHRVNLITDERVGEDLNELNQMLFTKKVSIQDVDYYLTAQDTESGILASLVESSRPFSSVAPIYMRLTNSRQKDNISTLKSTGMMLQENLILKFTSRAIINGVWYYRTEADTKNILGKALPESVLSKNLSTPFDKPRCMAIRSGAYYVDVRTGLKANTAVPGDINPFFTHKLVSSSTSFYQIDSDNSVNNHLMIPSNYLIDSVSCYVPFENPRNMKLNVTSPKTEPISKNSHGSYPKGMVRKFTSKTYIGGVWYFRTEANTNEQINLGFASSVLSEL